MEKTEEKRKKKRRKKKVSEKRDPEVKTIRKKKTFLSPEVHRSGDAVSLRLRVPEPLF